jgi:hypothetical protein
MYNRVGLEEAKKGKIAAGNRTSVQWYFSLGSVVFQSIATEPRFSGISVYCLIIIHNIAGNVLGVCKFDKSRLIENFINSN